MTAEVVGPEEIRKRLSMADAIDVLAAFFASPGDIHAPERVHMRPREGADLLLMPAWDRSGAGVKLVTVDPERNPSVAGTFCLFSEDLTPRAFIDAPALTALRTAAVSGFATRALADPHAARLVVFGAGVQAEAHIEAMRAVRAIEQVVIVSRTESKAVALAGDVGATVGPADAVADGDIVCTCTTSGVPLFDGSLLREGVHINAVGAFKPDRRELDEVAVRRAKIVVEERAAAAAEAGDLLLAVPRPEIEADLFEVASGRSVRTSAGDITLFKSVGVAYEDLVIARALLG